jgi:glutamate/tyrosine decarboxylase-like PLP-dependent enzyme
VIERLRAPLETVAALYTHLLEQPDIEPLHRPDTGIVCFRVVPEGVGEDRLDSLQQHVYESFLAGGRRSISITQIDGRAVLRLVAISPGVTFEDVVETVEEVRTAAESFN